MGRRPQLIAAALLVIIGVLAYGAIVGHSTLSAQDVRVKPLTSYPRAAYRCLDPSVDETTRKLQQAWFAIYRPGEQTRGMDVLFIQSRPGDASSLSGGIAYWPDPAVVSSSAAPCSFEYIPQPGTPQKVTYLTGKPAAGSTCWSRTPPFLLGDSIVVRCDSRPQTATKRSGSP